jgi:NAD(P)-dependent dehydrogenase (short-subunit alcohol dehydrogenase family)
MKNKICVVTGATSGIGYAIAKGLAARQCTLVLIGRNDEKGKAVVEQLKVENGNQSIRYYNIDLSSQQQIRKVGAKISEDYPIIDVLINNAAQWTSRYELTEDGVEKQFAVNHLAYFLFTHMLYTSIANSRNGRIINIGSDSHRFGSINFNNPNLKNEYHGLKAYGQSKLANLLFSYELHRQKKEDHVSVYCVQPGLVKTDIGVKHTNPFHSLMWKLRRLTGITTDKAAAAIIYLAVEEEVGNRSGLYWDGGKPKPSSSKSKNPEDAKRLWKMSEELCGIKSFFKKEVVNS